MKSGTEERILIIEDNTFNLTILREALSPEFKVILAKTGELGLQLAVATPPPDLILLDILLPGIDGYEVCKRLKADPLTADIPVIFITVMGEEDDEYHGLDIGAIDYLVKPIKPALVQARVRNHLELRRAQAREADALRTREAFLSLVSHEIRTPVSAMMGIVEILEDSVLAEDRMHAMGLLKSASQSLLNLVNNLLDHARLQSGKLEMNEATFDIDDLVQGVMELLAIPAGVGNTRLYVYISPQVPLCLRGDDRHLRQILLNLVGNAVKFTSNGDVTLEIRNLEQKNGLGRLSLTVTDTGIGIPAENLPSIFDEFTQVNESAVRSLGGSGLGLSITRKLVMLMGGEIQVSSEVGEGTCFEVMLPLGTTSESNSEAKWRDFQGRALVVCASPTGRASMVATLQDQGLTAEAVGDLAEAETHLPTRKDELVFLCIGSSSQESIQWVMLQCEERSGLHVLLLVDSTRVGHVQAMLRQHPRIHVLPNPLGRMPLRRVLRNIKELKV